MKPPSVLIPRSTFIANWVGTHRTPFSERTQNRRFVTAGAFADCHRFEIQRPAGCGHWHRDWRLKSNGTNAIWLNLEEFKRSAECANILGDPIPKNHVLSRMMDLRLKIGGLNRLNESLTWLTRRK